MDEWIGLDWGVVGNVGRDAKGIVWREGEQIGHHGRTDGRPGLPVRPSS